MSAKVVKIFELVKGMGQMYMILLEEMLIMWELWGNCTDTVFGVKCKV